MSKIITLVCAVLALALGAGSLLATRQAGAILDQAEAMNARALRPVETPTAPHGLDQDIQALGLPGPDDPSAARSLPLPPAAYPPPAIQARAEDHDSVGDLAPSLPGPLLPSRPRRTLPASSQNQLGYTLPQDAAPQDGQPPP